ncbi:MAG TPA: DUF4124 domain-containing protein [Steroidobacteraceae bacterium]|jgi:hypothetical protein|nr:DUF4124 domain-containing protein [Steroidobacteraceae bacterium]
MRILLILAGLALSLAAASQEIYRWVDKDGVVHYSDQPDSPNAVLIDVIEPNAYEAQDAAAAANARGGDTGEAEDGAGEAPYASLSITSPAPDEVFFGADAVVNVSADLQGTLRPDDKLVFFLNGNRTEANGLGTEYAGLARGSYVLRASVLDAADKPVITSPQVAFHVRQPSINSPQSPTAPPKPQPPKPVPKPKPTPRPNSG